MDYNVIEARYVRDYVVWVRFRDGTEGEVDLRPELIPGFEVVHGRLYSPAQVLDSSKCMRHTCEW
jgi:hypothetical protein